MVANPGDDTIKLPVGEYDLSLGQLLINDASGSVMIKGIDGVASIDAQGSSQIIEIAAGSTAEFRDLTLTGGYSTVRWRRDFDFLRHDTADGQHHQRQHWRRYYVLLVQLGVTRCLRGSVAVCNLRIVPSVMVRYGVKDWKRRT